MYFILKRPSDLKSEGFHNEKYEIQFYRVRRFRHTGLTNEGENLLAKDVEMEAYSIEDNGQGVSFNVFVYNVEPGVTIDYATGKSVKD